MFAPSVIELSRGALRGNLRALRRRIGDVALTSVVKGNAYGHGVDVYVPLAEACGVRSFAVSGAGEAAAVDAVRGPDSELLVMGHLPAEALPWAIERGVAFFVFDLVRLRDAIDAARRVGAPARVHLEVETGLRRTGLEEDELPAAVELLRAHPEAVAVEGLCTHFAGAESSTNADRIRRQPAVFEGRAAWLASRGRDTNTERSEMSTTANGEPGEAQTEGTHMPEGPIVVVKVGGARKGSAYVAPRLTVRDIERLVSEGDATEVVA